MARRKIQIKRIENLTERQLTYSKKRKALFKKADELTSLYGAQVSIIMISNSSEIHEYISPSTTTNQLYNRYQKSLEINYHEKMQELEKLRAVNGNLIKEIRQKSGGDCLNDLSLEQLFSLENEMRAGQQIIRERKNQAMQSKIWTWRKKIMMMEQMHNRLLKELESQKEDPHHGSEGNGDDDHDSLVQDLSDLSLQPNQIKCRL